MGVLQNKRQISKMCRSVSGLTDFFFGTAARGTLQDVKTSRLFKL